MYNNQLIIKNNLELNLANKFGEQVKTKVALLIDTLAGKDTFVDNYLVINLQNILHLEKKDVCYLIDLALELSLASAFAPVLLLEKIPTLFFYGITREVGKFLSNIKNYGARAVSLFLGSDQLKTDDLIDVLEQSTISFYKKLLVSVNERHQDFGICCSIIMRFAAKIETVIPLSKINDYLDLCSTLIKKYGPNLAEQYIRNTPDFMSLFTLETTLDQIERLAKRSLACAEFATTFPLIAFAQTNSFQNNPSLEESQSLKIEILKTQNYLLALENPVLFNDLDFSALLINWPNLSVSIKSNVLFQLEKKNYKDYILNHPDIASDRNSIDQVTQSNWLKSWTYCGEVIDLIYIRKRIGSLLQIKINFSLESKSIVKAHQDIFDRSNAHYNNDRIIKMLQVVLSYCIDTDTQHELLSMLDFVLGKRHALKLYLSKTNLVIQAWERDPWVDYGRSDELFSCTGIGDYNAANAPGFLADLNLNNLDIWNNGIRVGRIHLCLIKDTLNNPLLLLDCVDGTERIIASKKRFNLIMDAIFSYAQELGINKIKINYDIDYNTTPKKFISLIENTLKVSSGIEFYSRFLSISTATRLIPYPCQTFLESFIKNNGGFIRGALINLPHHKQGL